LQDENLDAEIIMQIMTQIPDEQYKSATKAIQTMPATNRTLKAVQQINVDFWNTKYKRVYLHHITGFLTLLDVLK